jgi:hypothetical protein
MFELLCFLSGGTLVLVEERSMYMYFSDLGWWWWWCAGALFCLSAYIYQVCIPVHIVDTEYISNHLYLVF